jgi:KDO2-lipid IV(A) lauroyltransferase
MTGPLLEGQPVPTFAERLTDAEYAAAWRLVRALPHGLAFGAFRLGADLAARRDGAGARRLRANLARVVPDASPAELDVLVRDGLRSYARYWCEAFRLQAMDPVAVHAMMEPLVTGAEPFLAALDAGRGVVFALPHSGNWDVAGVWLVETLRRRGLEPGFTTVAQRLRPESLYRRFVDYRTSLGFEVVAAEDGSSAYRALTRRLKAGGVVCLVADRDLTAAGVEVTFLGEPTRFPAGPARLAALTDSLLLPAYPRFTADGWALPIAEPVPVAGRADVGAATQAVADAFGELIARAPADWHALQPIWTADRVPEPVAP